MINDQGRQEDQVVGPVAVSGNDYDDDRQTTEVCRDDLIDRC